MKQNRPLLICLSATRNYGWCTRAFLKANSQWADFIIIVDQMSTDGTREMCAEYNNVILIDDHNPQYSESRRCSLALNRAREIIGDKILVYLAIDEVLPANWHETDDGIQIIQSAPGDMFLIQWANLLPDNKHCIRINQNASSFMYRVFHDDNISPYDNGGLDMHTYALPYCERGREFCIRSFPLLHFGVYNQPWSYVKQRYYQMVDWDKNNRSVVTLSRMYTPDSAITTINDTIKGTPIDPKWLWKDFNLFELIDIQSVPYLCVYMKELIDTNSIRRYRTLDIWDKRILDYLQLNDPRPWWVKPIHSYLHTSQKFRGNIIVRIIDKVLKLYI